MRKPPAARKRLVQPLSPEVIEMMRALALEQGLMRDATLLSVLAYAGVRPGEALGLQWSSVQERTLLIDSAVFDGDLGPTKTRRARTVRLLKPLGRDLAEWRLKSGRVGDSALVFPRRDGKPWVLTDYKNWRRRFFDRVAEAVELEDIRPYDLRHSFVSLLIHEGRSIVDVARQAGHAPTMALDTYGHVFDEFDPDVRISAEARIERAREELSMGGLTTAIGRSGSRLLRELMCLNARDREAIEPALRNTARRSDRDQLKSARRARTSLDSLNRVRADA